MHTLRRGNERGFHVHRRLRECDPQEGTGRQSRLSEGGRLPEVRRGLNLCGRGAAQKAGQVVPIAVPESGALGGVFLL